MSGNYKSDRTLATSPITVTSLLTILSTIDTPPFNIVEESGRSDVFKIILELNLNSPQDGIEII
jgi:hypothetical protein